MNRCKDCKYWEGEKYWYYDRMQEGICLAARNRHHLFEIDFDWCGDVELKTLAEFGCVAWEEKNWIKKLLS